MAIPIFILSGVCLIGRCSGEGAGSHPREGIVYGSRSLMAHKKAKTFRFSLFVPPQGV